MKGFNKNGSMHSQMKYRYNIMTYFIASEIERRKNAVASY